MASIGEEVEYDSDPEEAKRSLAMRRREASDDEEGEEEEIVDHRSGILFDDSDGQGGFAESDDDEEEYNEDEEDEEGYDEDEEGNGVEEEVYERKDVEVDRHGAEESVVPLREADSNLRLNSVESVEDHLGNGKDGEEEKENEPFSVPKAGAFYMHDDRFRDNAAGRHRGTRGGRRLWESKDDRKWGHDKFEEINLQGRQYKEERSTSRGSYHGRGRGRATDRVYAPRSRKVYNDINNQTEAHRTARGRGPCRYEPAWKNDGQTTQTQQSGRPLEKTPHASSLRSSTTQSSSESESAPAKKEVVVTSSLNSASPPFYPSASNKDIPLTQKRDVQDGSMSRNRLTNVMDESFSVPQANTLLQGKSVFQSIGMNKVYIEKSTESVGKALNNLQLQTGSSGAPHPRVAGRGVPVSGQISYQSVPHQTQVYRVSASQTHAIQLSSVPGCTLTQPMEQHSASLSQGSSPPKALLAENSFESGEVDTGVNLYKSKMAIVGKGRDSTQGTGRSSFLYGGPQVMGVAGNMAVNHGDQNFPGTPAFLPFMQFGGQHPGGIGVPAVEMAFPGYVAHPQLSLGNSEMTWLPVLGGAAGAMGATYYSPYLAVDGAYTKKSGQTSPIGASSKENMAGKSNNELKPSQGPEIVSEEYAQRQNKPRRYSEMNFGQ